jgi:DNA-binding phage protein
MTAMASPDSLSVQLLQQVLKAADARGIDQARLAERAGLNPETISRAKKRIDMELSTIARLASVVGLQVVLQPAKVAATRAQQAPTRHTAPLSKARFGLSWSNPGSPEETLLRNALLQCRFDAILEAAAQDGVSFVRQQMKKLHENGDLSEDASARLERIVKSIERGFADADVQATS